MATAYTPGLKISSNSLIRKLRRLPIAGEVIVKKGDAVNPLDPIARAELPGIMRTVRAAEAIGIDPADITQAMLVEQGQPVSKGDVICQSKSFFGLFKSECRSPVDGVIDLVNPLSGNIGIREAPVPIEVNAFIKGVVAEVIQREGAVIETSGALIQGIFGIGGEKIGNIRIISSSPDAPVRPEDIPDGIEGQILIGGSGADILTLQTAAAKGAAALVVGGVLDHDLIGYLGYDIGVAITGQENIRTTVIITEGFGQLAMARRTWELLESLDGREASVNGATQIRAGVIRPEIIVTGESSGMKSPVGELSLAVGSPIRLIREPYFGLLATVAELPPELQVLPSGSVVRVLRARLEDGTQVTVPRANVELIEA